MSGLRLALDTLPLSKDFLQMVSLLSGLSEGLPPLGCSVAVAAERILAAMPREQSRSMVSKVEDDEEEEKEEEEEECALCRRKRTSAFWFEKGVDRKRVDEEVQWRDEWLSCAVKVKLGESNENREREERERGLMEN